MPNIEIESGLEGFLAKDLEAIAHSRQYFNPEFSMISRLASTYDRMCDLVKIKDQRHDLPAQLLLVVNDQLCGVVSALLRRRTTDAQALTRGAIEATGIAYRVWEQPVLSRVFYEAHPYLHLPGRENAKRWERSPQYRKEFSSPKLFSREGRTWKWLRTYYGMFSTIASHAGRGALLRQRFEEGYWKLPPRETDGQDMGRAWVQITYAYGGMLKVFLKIMSGALKNEDQKMIEEDMKAWFTDFERQAKDRPFWTPKSLWRAKGSR